MEERAEAMSVMIATLAELTYPVRGLHKVPI